MGLNVMRTRERPKPENEIRSIELLIIIEWRGVERRD